MYDEKDVVEMSCQNSIKSGFGAECGREKTFGKTKI